MNRRAFIQATALTVAGCTTLSLGADGNKLATPTAKKLPRWRGFNLTEKCVARQNGNRPYAEKDFALLAEWGFDFARLPASYLCWSSHDNPREMREAELKDLDQAVAFGRKHSVYTSLNLHRAPGYCVNPPAEPWDLWKDEQAQDACVFQWAQLAKRFKGVPNEHLSFDLLNEPAKVSDADYARVARKLAQAIRAEDAGRLIIADGLRWGRDPVMGLVELGVAQSTRGYDPMEVSHYQASWVEGADKWPEPMWPLQLHGRTADKEFLRRDRIAPWQALEQKGVGVHVGEWGAHNRTPHKVALAWMRDCLELWREAGWGWALWNLRGSFGVMNSGRTDVAYEDFRGDKLDRAMLKLLQAY